MEIHQYVESLELNLKSSGFVDARALSELSLLLDELER